MPILIRALILGSVVIATYIAYSSGYINLTPHKSWTVEERKILRSLWIESLPTAPTESSNAVSNDIKAAEFGLQLFFDTRLSANGQVSCSTCHNPTQFFTDGLKLAVGAQTGVRNSMSIIGAAHSPWLFWDGRTDSLWSQALSPLENDLEHAGSRMQYVHLITSDARYREMYKRVFGPLPDFSDQSRFPNAAGPVANNIWNQAWQSMTQKDKETVTNVFVNIGKSIGAYERLLQPGPSKFDLYLKKLFSHDNDDDAVLTKNEQSGLRLFIGKAQCINCHNGPLLTNNEFHNTGILSSPGNIPSMGRVSAVRKVGANPFNCIGPYSDADENDCAELKFAKTGDELIGTHKVPSLRNVAQTAPYMHAGQFSNLSEVIEHYNRAPNAMIGHNEAKPLNLNHKEKNQLEAFLHTLTGTIAADEKWLTRPISKYEPVISQN